MKSTIRRWGNGAAVRIPDEVRRVANLHIGQEVGLRMESGSVIFQPKQALAPDLASMVAGITDDNLHGEVTVGNAAGRECW
jgi:antitoxin MazE